MAFRNPFVAQEPKNIQSMDTIPNPEINLNIDVSKILAEVDKALASINFEKIMNDVQQSLQKINFGKMQMQIQNEVQQSLRQIDFEKMQKDIRCFFKKY